VPLDGSELYTGFAPIRASHVKQFYDLLTGITTDQAVSLKNGLSVTNGFTLVSGVATFPASSFAVANLVDGDALALLRTNGAGNATEWGTAGQIAFPAIQNPSADANTYDDYEEGTFTPAIGGTATYTDRSGFYTKVGNTVFYTLYVLINLRGTGSTTTISGLPFASGAAGGGPAAVSFYGGLAINQIFVSGLNTSATATIVFNTSAASSAASTGTPAIIG